MRISRSKLKYVHRQSCEVTLRMWRYLRKYILREIDMCRKYEPGKYKDYTVKDWIKYIRYVLVPEWSALVDYNYKLRAFRYGFAGEDILLIKRCWTVKPKPYSVGFIHYHPRKVELPSCNDMSNFVRRFKEGERIFGIHTDYGTIFYIFGEKISGWFPKEFESVGIMIFGFPRSLRLKLHKWWKEMISEGYIKVVKVKEDRSKVGNKVIEKIVFGGGKDERNS